MSETIELAEKFKEDTVNWRRFLHSIPEPSFEEHRTAEFVSGKLKEFGYEVREGIAKTGVVAELGEGPVIAIRAELDGLDTPETNPVIYVSTTKGYSHSCGHDANMACVLTAARIIAEIKPKACVRIIMQPASEVASDENMMSGASRFIEEGALDSVEYVLGMHTDGTLDSGKIGIIEEVVLAREDSFSITLTDLSEKQKSNPAALGASIIQEIFSAGNLDKIDSGSIVVETLSTIEQADLEISGKLFYKSKDMFNLINHILEEAVKKICGTTCNYNIDLSETENAASMDSTVVDILKQAALKVLPQDDVRVLTRKTWSEDFSAYAALRPSAMALIGTRLPGQPRVVHSGNFDVDDSKIHLAAGVLVEAVIALSKK